jgi:hypothetical protein
LLHGNLPSDNASPFERKRALKIAIDLKSAKTPPLAADPAGSR